MTEEMKIKVERHKNFLDLKDVDRPLRGCCIEGNGNSGSDFYRKTQPFMNGYFNTERLNKNIFSDLYNDFSDSVNFNDDLIRTIDIRPAIPWTEAAVGCPVVFTGKSFRTEPLKGSIDEAYMQFFNKEDNIWLHKYEEVLDYLKNNLEGRYPIGQGVLGGPLDMVTAAVGERNIVFKLMDRREAMKNFISLCSDIFADFLELQIGKTPWFHNGYVMGQYYIWTPGTCAVLQEDAMSLFPSGLYEEFAMTIDEKISRIANCNLFHMHATSMHLLDYIIGMKGIQIIQVSKEEESFRIENIIGDLRKIQTSGKGRRKLQDREYHWGFAENSDIREMSRIKGSLFNR